MAGKRKSLDKPEARTVDRLEAALERLKAGQPTHPKLIEALKLRKLRAWSPTALALESGVSKKSFDREGSNYPEIWQKQQEIKALVKEGKPTIASRSTTDVNRLLRERNKELEHQNKMLLTENAALVRRIQAVDPEMTRKLREQERLAARGSRNPNQMPAKSSTDNPDKSVVRLYPDQGE